MDANYHAHQTPQFRVLSDGQIERLFRATLECLSRTGVDVHNGEGRDLLADAGAHVDGSRVRIPPSVIQDAIAANPRSFTLWGRTGEHSIQVVPDRVYFGPGPTCTYFVDPDTGERRKTRRGDAALTARVCDVLDNIDYVMSLGLIGDVTPSLAPVYEFAEMIVNTGKPVLPWGFSLDNVSDIYEIAKTVAGGEDELRSRPFFAFFSTFQPPLVHTEEDVANVFWAADHGVPIVYLGGGSAGATAPVTAAGTLVISLAGMLSGLAMIQLRKRGSPVCIGAVPQPMDLRTGRPCYGAPEMSLFSAGLSDVCRYLGVPFMGTAGASEAKTLDLQAAIESTMQVVLSALSGATLVHDVGFLDCADIGSLEMLVMTDEIIGMVRRVLRGIVVDDDSLMLDLIDRVGPAGHFLAEEETATRCRDEIWAPTLMDRDAWDGWQLAGSPTMHSRIQKRLRAIVKDHRPPPLPDGVQEGIDSILEVAESRARKQGARNDTS